MFSISLVPSPKVGLASRVFKVGLALRHITTLMDVTATVTVSVWPLLRILQPFSDVIINQLHCRSMSGTADVMLPQL